MNSIQICLKLRDQDYRAALARAITSHYKNITVNILDIYEEITDSIDYIISDSEEQDYISFGNTKIYRYASVHEIVSSICAHINDSGGLFKAIKHENDIDSKSIGIFGRQGGSGTSSFSQILAREAALYYNRKVLVISLSMYGDEWALESSKYAERMLFEPDYVDITKYVLQDQYDVYHLRTKFGLNPLSIANATECKELVNKLCEALNINLTIYDFGSELSFEKMKLLSEMNEVCLISRKLIEDNELENIIDLIKKVSDNGEMKVDYVIINNALNNSCKSEETGFYIDYSPESFSGKIIDHDMSFGIDVSKIAKCMFA